MKMSFLGGGNVNPQIDDSQVPVKCDSYRIKVGKSILRQAKAGGHGF